MIFVICMIFFVQEAQLEVQTSISAGINFSRPSGSSKKLSSFLPLKSHGSLSAGENFQKLNACLEELYYLHELK